MKQRRPASLVEAVTYAIEIESYLQRPAKLVNTIQNQQGIMVMVKTLEEVTQRLQKLEATMQDLSRAEDLAKAEDKGTGIKINQYCATVLIVVLHRRETRILPCCWPGMEGGD